jgi:hypothetical protein
MIIDADQFQINLLKLSFTNSVKDAFHPRIDILKKFKNLKLIGNLSAYVSALSDNVNNAVFFVE